MVITEFCSLNLLFEPILYYSVSSRPILIRKLALELPDGMTSLDAQTLLAHITGHNRAWLLSHTDFELSSEQRFYLEKATRQLHMGVPLPYVLGHWEFFGLDFLVTKDVLIPRPETELLVETVLAEIRSQPKPDYQILDIGTGSGIIAISLAVHIPNARLAATDISSSALKLAYLNSEHYGVSERIQFIEANLLPDGMQAADFDIICANLPYIPSETLSKLEIYGKEPSLALDGGIDGLDLIRKLMSRLEKLNPPSCLILLEIEQRQGQAVNDLARKSFPNAAISIKRDLAGFDRLIVIRT